MAGRGRPKEVIDADLAAKAREALSGSAEFRVGRRLQAIASAAEHPIEAVARMLGVTRQAIWSWARRFREGGLEGLKDKPKGHRPAKLSASQREEVDRWIASGRDEYGSPVHWTIERLRDEILARFGVKMGRTPVWVLIRGLGFRQKVPRPRHAKADEEVQEAFKKKPPRRSGSS